MDGDACPIGKLVEQGAMLHAQLLDGFATVPSPVYWLDYEAGQLRYARAGPEARINAYQIDRVAVDGLQFVTFHTSGETSVAALFLTPCVGSELVVTLHSYARRMRGHDPYPLEGWRFRG